MMMIPKILNLNDCDWMQAREGVRGKRFHGDNMTVQIGELTTGNEQVPHKHENEQIAMILGGECDFYVDGVPYPLTEGCIMAIPPNAEHYLVAKGSVPVINLDIFYPKRMENVESVPRPK